MKSHHITQLHDPALGLIDLPETTAASLLEPLFELESPSLHAHRHPVMIGGELYELPKILLLGARGGGIPIRIAIFAGLDAGHLETVAAIARLLLQFELNPILARDYALFAYPIVNAPGFGPDRNRYAALQTRWARHPEEEDARFFHSEIDRLNYHGIIQFRSSGLNPVFTATSRSELLAREVIAPALRSIKSIVPVGPEPVRVLPSSLAARSADHESGRLVPDPVRTPVPFEVELYAPAAAQDEVRASALFLATVQILHRYRRFIAHGAEL